MKEVIRAVRSQWPKEKPIILRVSAEEYDKEGNHHEDVARIINEVKVEGVDIINVSSGGVIPASIHSYHGYQVKFAEIIKEKTDLPVIAGGLIVYPYMAEEVLQNNRADMIFLGRVLLRKSYWALEADLQLNAEVAWTKQYERGKARD